MAIFLVLIAAVFVSISNLAMRKSVDAGGSAKAFLVFQMIVAFLVAILVNPVRTRGKLLDQCPYCGIRDRRRSGFALMLYALGRAVEKGPPGITFSILNAATVMPGLVMALLFWRGTRLHLQRLAWNRLDPGPGRAFLGRKRIAGSGG